MTEQISELLTQPILFVTLVMVWLAAFSWITAKFFDILIRYVFSKTKTTTDDDIVRTIRNIVLAGLFVTALFIISIYSDVSAQMHDNFFRFYIAVMIVLAAFLFSEIISIIVVELTRKSYETHGKHLYSAIPFLNNIGKVVIFALATLGVMWLYDIDVTPAIASAGVAGVALAFAAKDFVANLFGGISVFFDKPYTVGDYVIIQNEYRGEVMEIGMRSTKIRTRDSVLLTVPNSVMVTNAIVNETGYDMHLRVRLPILVEYDSDLDEVEQLIVNVLEDHKEILKRPAPRVRYRAFNENGIELEALFVIPQPSERGRILHEVIKDLYAAMKKHDIHIPYPRREVLLHKSK